jgi:hypothetical protein
MLHLWPHGCQANVPDSPRSVEHAFQRVSLPSLPHVLVERDHCEYVIVFPACASRRSTLNLRAVGALVGTFFQEQIGMGSALIGIVLLFAQLCGILGALIFRTLSNKIGLKQTSFIVLTILTASMPLAYFVSRRVPFPLCLHSRFSYISMAVCNRRDGYPVHICTCISRWHCIWRLDSHTRGLLRLHDSKRPRIRGDSYATYGRLSSPATHRYVTVHGDVRLLQPHHQLERHATVRPYQRVGRLLPSWTIVTVCILYRKHLGASGESHDVDTRVSTPLID